MIRSTTRFIGVPARPALLVAGLCLASLAFSPAQASAQATPTPAPAPAARGTLAGVVSNLGTANLLQGARVEIVALGRFVFTDNTGRFSLPDIPTGTHEVTASYIGLEPLKFVVAFTAGPPVRRDFELTSPVYKLGEFKVTGEREGNAASLTRQRNSPNVRNVVALDAFGNLPNDSAGELLVRLPGVAGRLDDEGNVTGVIIRGAPPNLNTVSVDGNLQASAGGLGRDFRTNAISGALFEELEVIKAPTPDMPADSLGGAVNLKTRSALAIKERRRLDYRASARWAPDFYNPTPTRAEHPLHPLLNLGYQEVFSVGGGARNLGVSLTAFYSENAAGFFQTLQDYQFAVPAPAYVWDYRTTDTYNNRSQASVQFRADYRLAEHTRFFIGAIYNDAFERFNRTFTTRAFTARTVATLDAAGQPTGTGAILPGWTDQVTRVRGVAASTVQLNSTLFSFLNRERQINGGAVHKLAAWEIDYDAFLSLARPNLANGQRDGTPGGGIFTLDAPGIGWTLDKTSSAAFPKFTQTGGAPLTDIGSYRNGIITVRDSDRDTVIYGAKANARYTLPFTLPTRLKLGGLYRDQRVDERSRDRRWNYTGAQSLAPLVDPKIVTITERRSGLDLPFIDSAVARQDIINNPARWTEDLYYAGSRLYQGTRGVTEQLTSAFVQGDTRLIGGRLGLLAGVRWEKTDVATDGFVPARVLSTTAQRAADPFGSAVRDQNNRRSTAGAYDDFFPGAHATYRIAPGLQGRLSWSNSIGRVPLSNLLPLETVSDAAQTITINNPALKPQDAENWDVALEYYFEPVGQISVGYFRKNIADFIVTSRGGTVGTGPGNGYNGDYAGYAITTQFNGGSAVVDGWEFNYQQQLSFLPALLKNTSFFANYTALTTAGDYGDTGRRSTAEVAQFIPETGNAGLTWKYRAVGLRALVNYTGAYLQDYSADASRLRYRVDRTVWNFGATWDFRRYASFFIDVQNAFDEPIEFYRAVPGRLERYTDNGTTLVFGVTGRF